MSRSLKFRHFLRELSVTRLWSVWTRSYTLSSVVKRCRKDRSVREVLQNFKQTLFRSKRTLLLSVTAAYKNDDVGSGEEDKDGDVPCYKNITDEELEALTSELETVDELSKLTLYCTTCGRRLAIDKRYSGVRYCSCKVSTAENDSHDGWVPYMEADDVIIWRKEYKSGQRYAYKVYGRYHDVVASDFAAVQVDGRYRRAWDAAVAALSTVEDNANGVRDQTVLHWEVMWPRMFSNRDYVYIRRHKHYHAQQKHLEYKDELFKHAERENKTQNVAEHPTVYSHAKRKAMESEELNAENRVYVIISKSCVHEAVPETKTAVRVKDYWSNMVVKSLHGTDKPGMEFVLTYYDDAGGGGLPGGVTAWATGRAAPAYLARMRRAAIDYTTSPHFEIEPEAEIIEITQSEQLTKDQSTQTDTVVSTSEKQPPRSDTVTQTDTDSEYDVDATVKVTDDSSEAKEPESAVEIENVEVADERLEVSKKETAEPEVEQNEIQEEITPKQEDDGDCVAEDDKDTTWWRYLYPFYYFL